MASAEQVANPQRLGQTNEFAYLAAEAWRRLSQINGPQERHE